MTTQTKSNESTSSSVDESQNPSSPFYLHLGENPGAILVSQQLNGSNYHTWSRSMQRALLSKNKYKFVNGSTNADNCGEKMLDAWETCNTMVVSWITRSITQQIAQSIVYIDSAQELWEDLKERFSKGDHFRTSDLMQEIHSIKQGDRTISTYFTDMKILWEELESLRPIPQCSCNTKCICDLLKTIKQYKDKDNEYVICFLKGQNDQYNTIKGQILLMEPLPLINKLFSLTLQQERQFGGSILGESTSLLASNAGQANTKGSTNQSHGKYQKNFQNNNRSYGNSGNFGATGQRGQTKYSTNNGRNYNNTIKVYNKEGHTVDICYFKHGFPPDFVFKYKPHAGSVNNIVTKPVENYDNEGNVTSQFTNTNPGHHLF